MDIVAITLARVISLIQVQTFDPFGTATTLEALQKLVARYTFAKFPKTFEELDFQKGIELSDGKLDALVIDKITVYPNGVVVDTRSSTDNSEKVLLDLLDIARQAFGANIKPVQQNFVSQIIFRSDLRLTALNPVLGAVADTLTAKVSADMKQPFQFEPTAILIHADVSNTKIAPVVFSMERRVDVPFFQNTYFSNAPLRTADHIQVLKDFEKSLLDQSV